MLPIRISQDNREPIYHQIELQLKALISSGQLPAGTPLPSIRVLAKELECSGITTRRAYHDLEQQGFIRTIQGKGTFVAEVEAGMKKDLASKTVHDALDKAIDTAVQHDYELAEIKKLFLKIIEERMN